MNNRILILKSELRQAINSFSKKERLFFVILVGTLFFSALIIFQTASRGLMIEVPRRGGIIKEGIIGFPRFVNPILAASDSDKDLVALIYSGLMQKTAGGGLEPDLAQDYHISKDGLVYIFTLRKDALFHDGKPVTADDVIFTIEKAKSEAVKSPRKVSWEGVTAEKSGQNEIRFTLEKPYAPFLENTTLGVLPRHLWQETQEEQFSSSNYNLEAVGSGPFKIRKIIRKKKTGAAEEYQLKPFAKFKPRPPFLRKMVLKFYSNEEELIKAFQRGKVKQTSAVAPEKIDVLQSGRNRVETAPLSRIFGLFFNKSQNKIFADKKIIEVLDKAINKERIIEEVLSGYGLVLDSPVPPGILNAWDPVEKESPAQSLENKKEAEKILRGNGEQLSFSISTSDMPELKRAAELIKEDLEDIGAKVEIKIFDTGNLNQNVIRPRKYEALLFGQVVNHPSNLFAFWHSSQQNDPGLNVAFYANSKADKFLDDALNSLDPGEAEEKYLLFESEIKQDKPAVFIYAPDFIYLINKNLRGFSLERVSVPSDRFLGAKNWYLKTDKIWKIFNQP